VQLPNVSDAQFASSLAELERLATTLGLRPIARVTQRRSRLAPGVVLGEGKLVELARWTGGTGVVPAYRKPGTARSDEADGNEADGDEAEAQLANQLENDSTAALASSATATVVLVDHELSPTQQHNLERATGVDVLDRTSVILEIFHRHAKTREARLQVELARLRYLAPRLRVGHSGGDRVRGGVGGKGAGESALELDRRRIRDRVAEIKAELARVEGGSSVRRERRSQLPTVALVGYTNAGKSSLMRALTSTEVYIADKLFATLDTTVRRLVPPTDPPILVSDTVGFINKLPHDLVASFRSTLDEAADCDLLLHMVDASDPAHADQLAVTRTVLSEIGADLPPAWLILNKIDRVEAAERDALMIRFPDAIQLSATSPNDVARLRDRLIENFGGALEDELFIVPWAQQKLVHTIYERTTVLEEQHDDDGTRIRVRAPKTVLASLRARLAG
jgi:GTP-binding protein HflX